VVGFSYLWAKFSQSTAAVSQPRISRGFLTVNLEKVDIRVKKSILDRKIQEKSRKSRVEQRDRVSSSVQRREIEQIIEKFYGKLMDQ